VFPSALADGTPTPECFELVRIQLERVELLELTGHPHQRRRWHADQDWAEERLNP
jgi:pyridoxamine 5'-phosphate oxidase